MARTLQFTVPPEEDGLKLQSFLKKQGISRHLIIKLKRGGIAVNGLHRRMVDPVSAGDEVEITLGLSDEAKLIPNPDLPVGIVYEDEDFILFDKPPGMPVHPSALQYDDALGNFFAARYPGVTFRPLNRLDRNTTGLCFAAKNMLAAASAQKEAQKEYYAIVEGLLPEDFGTIDAPLTRVPGEVIRYEVCPDGKRAVTHYTVLQRTASHTLVRVKMETGRTHQIRVHFSHLGFPLAGDSLYGGHTERIGRQALHCGEFSFLTLAGTGLSFSLPLPEDMAALLE